MDFANARILIFAKAPVTGQVKTRLIPSVGAQRAAEIYADLLERIIAVADTGIAPVELWCAPDTRHVVFQRADRNSVITLHRQVSGDLGMRMAHAARQALGRGEMVLLIGGDCPVLEAGHLCQALTWLRQGEDAVLGPAEDGGYVLLGLRQAEDSLFRGISWGTGQVLSATRDRLARLGWSWRELETLWDLDREADLERYLAMSRTGESPR